MTFISAVDLKQAQRTALGLSSNCINITLRQTGRFPHYIMGALHFVPTPTKKTLYMPVDCPFKIVTLSASGILFSFDEEMLSLRIVRKSLHE